MIDTNQGDFPHNFLLTAFANNSSGNIKLSKTQLSKIIKSAGLLGNILGTFLVH